MSELDEAAIRLDERRRAAAWLLANAAQLELLAQTLTPPRVANSTRVGALVLRQAALAIGRGDHADTDPDEPPA